MLRATAAGSGSATGGAGCAAGFSAAAIVGVFRGGSVVRVMGETGAGVCVAGFAGIGAAAVSVVLTRGSGF